MIRHRTFLGVLIVALVALEVFFVCGSVVHQTVKLAGHVLIVVTESVVHAGGFFLEKVVAEYAFV